jgi:hypothetical protein
LDCSIVDLIGIELVELVHCVDKADHHCSEAASESNHSQHDPERDAKGDPDSLPVIQVADVHSPHCHWPEVPEQAATLDAKSHIAMLRDRTR